MLLIFNESRLNKCYQIINLCVDKFGIYVLINLVLYDKFSTLCMINLIP